MDLKLALKKKEIEKVVDTRQKQILHETDKKKRDEEKIEFMTQFMLDPTSSATKLLEKRREMYELQEALQRDKDKFIDKEEQFKKTEEELRNRDDDFHKKIVEYYKNSFEKKQTDNYNYLKNLDEQKLLQTQLTKNIYDLEESNNKLRTDLDKLVKIQKSLRKYEDFLILVKKQHPEKFQEIDKIILKFKTLKETYETIKEDEAKAKKKKEEETLNFRKIKSNYEIRINSILSNIQTLQTELKDQKEQKKKYENDVTNLEANSNSVVSSLEQILLAVDNIYGKCKEKKEWTQHEIDFKEFSNKKGYEEEGKYIFNLFYLNK